MSQEIKKILPVIFLIAAIGLGWLSWQGYADILIVQNQIKDAGDKASALTSAAEKINNFIIYTKESPEAVEKFNIFLSDNSNKPGIVSFLANGAFSNGLLLKSINFTDSPAAQPAAEENPSAQGIMLVFSGTYSSLKNFLVFTEKSLKLTDVVSIDFKSAPDGNNKSQIANYDFTVGLKTYYVAKKDNLSVESKILLANSLTDLSFAKEKQFMDLVAPQNYNIDTTDTGDWGNKNIF